MHHRACDAVEATAHLQNKHRDIMFYSPIVHSHPLNGVVPELGTAWECWKSIDEELISRFDELWVLMLDGWQDSRGVAAEVKHAQAEGKPVVYINDKTYEEVPHVSR